MSDVVVGSGNANVPDTGDNAPIGLFMAAALTSLCACAVIIRKKENA